MTAAPELRLLPGGADGPAPNLPGVEEGARLVLPEEPIRDRWIVPVFAAILVVHVAAVAAVMNLDLFGASNRAAIARAAGVAGPPADKAPVVILDGVVTPP